MKQTIPFKKDVFFKTQVNEITSISLEHHVEVVKNNTISGNFIITGEYKMTEASINKDNFEFDIPFDVALNEGYIIDNAKTQITDFFYEIVNNEILRINIEITINDLEVVAKQEVRNTPYEDTNEIPIIVQEEEKIEEIISLENTIVKQEIAEETKRVNVKQVSDLFKQLDEEESFSTYKVYIVREGDNIDSILDMYAIDIVTLEKYNNLESIEIGDKIIIPTK